MSQSRCPWAITIGTVATRCDRPPGHRGDTHEGPGLAEFPSQRIEWLDGDRRQFETTRTDTHAWTASS